jgi:hypothetical protein
MTGSPPDVPVADRPGAAEVDAVAAVVLGCPGVSALDGGRFGEIASYLPGRVVPGVAVDEDRIRVQVRSAWGIPAAELAALITLALAPLAGPRPVDVTIADIDDPPPAPPAAAASVAVPSRPGAAKQPPGGPVRSATGR